MKGRALPLAAVLVLAASLRLWRLGQNGYGNEYYAAGVRSMSAGWHNFLYAAFDPAGFVSVDKPPFALWIQVASVKLFGFHGFSVLVPQVLEGVASVWLVAHLVRRRFGDAAGLLAGLFLAVTPVSVAIDRSSNTDSCLVLVLLLAAWALGRAAETDDRRFLALAAALVGLGFNVKMLAAFVVLPAFAVVYLLGVPWSWRRRLVDAGVAALALVAVSSAWMLAYDLTPPDRRPYAGTTDTNSVTELAVGPYGIGRFIRQVRPTVVAARRAAEPAMLDGAAEPAATPRRAASGPRTGAARLFVGAPTGPLRLADGQLAGQFAWLLPLAVAGLVLGARSERPRVPLAPTHLALVLWGLWALTYGIVYSAAGGIFHYYYLATMAPPLAALAGIGVVALWRLWLAGGWRAALLPTALLATAAWQIFVDATAVGTLVDLLANAVALRDEPGAWRSWLHGALVAGVLGAAVTLGVATLRRDAAEPDRAGGSRALAAGGLGMGLLATLLLPAAWSLSSVLVPGSGALPSGDIARLVHASSSTDARARTWVGSEANLATLVGFLRANRGEERYLLVTSSATLAAPIIVRTGEAVMARGGFHGLDPILTPERLARLVEKRQLRFVMLGDLSLVSRRMGAEAAGAPVADWVRANGQLVDPPLWRASRRTLMMLYDLRAEGAPLRAAPPADTGPAAPR